MVAVVSECGLLTHTAFWWIFWWFPVLFQTFFGTIGSGQLFIVEPYVAILYLIIILDNIVLSFVDVLTTLFLLFHHQNAHILSNSWSGHVLADYLLFLERSRTRIPMEFRLSNHRGRHWNYVISVCSSLHSFIMLTFLFGHPARTNFFKKWLL